MREAKEAVESIKNKIGKAIDNEKAETVKLIEKLKNKISSRKDFENLKDEYKLKVMQPFDDLLERNKNQRYIATIIQYRNTAESLFTEQLNYIQDLKTADEKAGEVSEPKVEYINRANIQVVFEKSELRSEAEVEEYVEALKKELLRQIKENRRITL